MVNYQQSKIYKLTSPHTDLFYIGSTTTTLKQRKWKHKSHFKMRQINEKAKCTISRKLFELGIDDVKINLVKEYSLENKEQLLKKEAKYIRKYKEKYGDKCLNICVPLRTRKEYCEDNKEKILETKRIWRDKNKEKVNKQKREYFQNNKEKVQDQQKVRMDRYIENHGIEHKRQKDREYWTKNKDEINKKRLQKKVCVCGSEYSQPNFTRHCRTKKHLDFIAKKEEL
jgi:hypothetical protein